MHFLMPHPPGVEASPSPRRKETGTTRCSFLRRRLLALFAALLAVGTMSLGSSAPALAADTACLAHTTCVWNAPYFEGAKRSIGAGEAGYWIAFDNYKQSIRNNFGQRVVWTYSPFVGFRCWGPGAVASSWLAESHLYIGATGSRC